MVALSNTHILCRIFDCEKIYPDFQT